MIFGPAGKKDFSNAGGGEQGSLQKNEEGAYTLNFLQFLCNYISCFTTTIAPGIHTVVSPCN